MEKNSQTQSFRRLPCYLRTRLIVPSIGVFVGVSVAAVFCVRFHNYNVAGWGLLSGIAAALALIVSLGSIKGWWEPNPRVLKRFMLVGCLTQLFGICGFVAYLTLGITRHQGLVIYGPGYYLTCVWCFMTWKWGFITFYYSRAFLREFGYNALLVQEHKSSYASLVDDPPVPAAPPATEDASAEEPPV